MTTQVLFECFLHVMSVKFVYELAGKFYQYSPCLGLVLWSECDNDIKWRGQTRTQSYSILLIKMILDGEQVLEGVSKTFVRYPGEEHSAWLQRLTHLHCQNQVMADK